MLCKLISTEIPKWALPKEQVSLYIKIHKIDDIKQIIVKIPEYFIVNELINVRVFEKQNNDFIITKIGKLENNQNYFGIVLLSTKYFTKLATKNLIKIIVITNSGTEEIFYEHARIFRPKMEVDIDNEIILSNNQNKIPLHVKFIGFGDISIRIEAEIGGKIVTKGALWQ